MDIDSTGVCSSDPPATPESDEPPITNQGIRRRPIRGYQIHSDDDCHSDEGDQHFAESKPIFDDNDSITCNDDTLMDPDDSETLDSLVSHQEPSIESWITFSLLPRYTEKVEVPPFLSPTERILASFTLYRELKEANMDSHFEQIFVRLQLEWTYMGGLVCRFYCISTFCDHELLFLQLVALAAWVHILIIQFSTY